ncbi:MAG: hypothetical protein PHT50_06290 [Candidatus Omnitrophica bacterium]|nr:hypothetical protein [Candidatus Omnitrophota bacterium]
MRKIYFIALSAFIICLSFKAACFGKDNAPEQEIGRYQIYSSPGQQSFIALLDTKTGKVWQLSTDMSGKAKFEGLTVEGIVYANKDTEALYKKINEIDLGSVADKYRKACKDKLIAVFSYQPDSNIIDSIIKEYPVQTE